MARPQKKEGDLFQVGLFLINRKGFFQQKLCLELNGFIMQKKQVTQEHGVKSYQFTVVWGAERTTNDLEGEVIKVSHQRPTTEDIKALLPEYIGLILQTPPQYSAIRINGLHAYTLARSGKRVAIPPREVKINALDLIRITSEGHAVFEIECGKGTYIRSLARDMGYALGCYGYVADLRRFGVFPFTADDFITFAELEEACPSRSDFSLLDAFLLETSVALKSLPHYAIVDKKMADRICSGNPVFLHGRQQEKLREADRIYVRHKGRILAIGYISKGAFQPTRVF